MTLTEASIRAGATAKSYARGYDYYERGQIRSLIRRGDTLTAAVQGSDFEPYQVQITLYRDGVESSLCSCPYDWGGYCKHEVAVLLSYIQQQETIESRPEFDTLLDTLSAEQLRTILTNLVTYQPGLLSLVEDEIAHQTAVEVDREVTSSGGGESELPSISPTLVRDSIRKHFDQFRYEGWGGYYDDYHMVDPAGALESFIPQVEQLLQHGKPSDALNLLKRVAEIWLEEVGRLDEYFLEMMHEYESDGVTSFDRTLAECLLSVELSPAGRSQWQRQLENWSHTLPLLISTTALEQGWDYPALAFILSGQTTIPLSQSRYFEAILIEVRLTILARQERYDEYLHLAKAQERVVAYVTMLIQRGRVDEAFAYAQEHTENPNQVLTMSQSLFNAGRQPLAFQLATRGLSTAEHGKYPLACWLRDNAHTAKELNTARYAAEIAFENNSKLDDYLKAKEVAGDTWLTMRPRLLNMLKTATSYTSEPVDIYLHENMVTDAMRVVENRNYYGSGLPRVIEAAMTEHPNWVIRQCKKQGEAIMDAGRSQDYDVAVSWMRQAKQAYVGSGRGQDWQTYLNQLLETHHRKYKLVPMLKKLK